MLEADSEISLVLEKLDKYGICVIKNFLSELTLSALQYEFDQVLSAGEDHFNFTTNKNFSYGENGQVAKCKTVNMTEDVKAIKSTFTSDFMRKVAEGYFGVDCEINDDIYLTHDLPSKKQILPWHFDRQQSLKFYINLVNVSKRNGSLEYDIGSHREGHFRANYYVLSGVEIKNIPNDIPAEELHNPTVIAVNAGDLIIFDPDGFHKGGVVSVGYERKVIRGHAHPIPIRGYNSRLFDAHWWIQSCLNLSKILKTRGSRTLPRERLTRANLGR